MSANDELPEYLSSLDALHQHFRGQLSDLSTTEMGLRFAKTVQKLVPYTEVGESFQTPDLNAKQASDGGVDLSATSRDGTKVLYIQAKLWVDRAERIDSVVSKFQAFSTTGTERATLFPLDDEKQTHYMLVTLSPLDGLLKRYRAQAFSSRNFFDQCLESGRIHILDGTEILQLLRVEYGKLVGKPREIRVRFDSPLLVKDNVYIGVLSSTQIKALYRQFKESLFFENVRDFLGIQESLEKVGRSSPNLDITKTLKEMPQRMLARNNGIVFGAERIKLGDEDNELILEHGSIVNGCQTTMCIVRYADSECYVVTKVVQTSDAWDITKAANYQEWVPEIDLELARYVRPQLVKRAATRLGFQVQDSESSAIHLIDEIYANRIAYFETRLLYIGLFSRSPNNVFASNYTELKTGMIRGLLEQKLPEDEIFDLLFRLQSIGQECLEQAKVTFTNPSYSAIFERLYSDDNLSYRSLISILALCGATGIDIGEPLKSTDEEVERMTRFVALAKEMLTVRKERFRAVYPHAVAVWMQDRLTEEDEVKLRRDMYVQTKRTPFTSMFRKLAVQIDLNPSIALL